MKKLSYLFVFFSLFLVYNCGNGGVDDRVQQFNESVSSRVSFLYSLSAESGSFAQLPESQSDSSKTGLYQLTMNLTPKSKGAYAIQAFSDRPARFAHPVSLVNFLYKFYGSGTFAGVSPNAALYYSVKSSPAEQKTIFIKLMKPKFDKATGKLTFQFRPLRGSSARNLDLSLADIQNPTMFIDNAVAKPIEHAADDLGNDIKRGADDLANSIHHLADDVANGVTVAADDIASGVKEAAEDTAAAAKDIESEFGKIGDDIASGMVWFFDQAKCYIVEAGMDVAGVTAEALVDVATDGDSTITWEAFVASFEEAAVSEGAVQIFANLVGQVAKSAGASTDEENCIKGLSDVIFAQALEWGSYSAFAIDLIKAVTMAKIGCDSFVSACF